MRKVVIVLTPKENANVTQQREHQNAIKPPIERAFTHWAEKAKGDQRNAQL